MVLVYTSFSKALCRFISYFFYVLILGYLIFIVESYRESILGNSIIHGNYLIFLTFFTLIYPILLGILFALPHLISNLKKTGIWQFDLVRFLAVGLPLTYWMATPYLLWAAAVKYQWLEILVAKWQPPYLLSGVVFGIVLMTAFNKRSPNNI